MYRDRERGVGGRVWGVGEEDIPTPHKVHANVFSRGNKEIFVSSGVARSYKTSLLQAPLFIYGVDPHPKPHTLHPRAALDSECH